MDGDATKELKELREQNNPLKRLASERRRSGLSPMVMSRAAAVSVPGPKTGDVAGAVPATKVARDFFSCGAWCTDR